MDSVKTKSGTILPLMNLKGKPYMQVAHRIVWFNEDVVSYTIDTQELVLTEDRATIKATVQIYDKEGKLVKRAVGTKSEAKKDFADFHEKAETGAIGRAITALGFGTAYALADLEEGERIIDAPVTTVKAAVTAPSTAAAASDGLKPASPQAGASSSAVAANAAPVAPRRSSSFRNRTQAVPAVNGATAPATKDEWS